MLVERLRSSLTKYADQAALVSEYRSVSYGQLAQLIERIAPQIFDVLDGSHDVVAIRMSRGSDYVACLLATWYAGGIVMPLDAAWPISRLSTLVTLAKPRLLIESDGSSPLLPDVHSYSVGTLRFSRMIGGALHHLQDRTAWGQRETPYLVFTSGSTGTPKGIRGGGPGLERLLEWEISTLNLGEPINVAHLAPISFDASFRDVLAPLMDGGTVLVPSEETRSNPRLLASWLQQVRANVLHAVPSLARLVAHELLRDSKGRIATVRAVLLAGEPIYGRDVDLISCAVNKCAAIYNLYGASESTMFCSARQVHVDEYSPDGRIPIGAGIAGGRVWVSSDDDNAFGSGTVGEICVSTPNGTCGYLDAKENNGKFQFSNSFDSLVYRTGDVGQSTAGEIYYLGRRDNQVKVSGNLVNLAEVERVAFSISGVDQVVALAGTAADSTEITLVISGHDCPSDAELRSTFLTTLPRHFCPQRFIRMERLPLTPSGKIDRQALRDEPRSSADKNRQVVAKGVEGMLCDLFGPSTSKRVQSFFDVAGSSLDAMRLIAAIHRELGCRLTIKEIFEHPQVTALQQLIDKRRGQDASAIVASGTRIDYPLSPYQHSMWLMTEYEPARRAYTEATCYRVAGPLDLERCNSVLRALIRDHEILRTRYVLRSDETRQVVDPPHGDDKGIEFVDLSFSSDPEYEVRVALDRAIAESWDLAAAAPFRVLMFKTAAECHIVCVVWFHILADMRTVNLLARAAARRYMRCCDRVQDAPPSQLRFRDVAEWQVRSISEQMVQLRDFWALELASLPPPLRLDERARPPVRRFKGRSFTLTLDSRTTSYLRNVALLNQTTLFVSTLGAFVSSLCEVADTHTVVVGLPATLRSAPEIQDVLGYLVNPMPLKVTIQDEPFEALVGCIKGNFERILGRNTLPFEELVQISGSQTALSRSPLYDVEFTLVDQQESHLLEYSDERMTVQLFRYYPPTAKYDISLIAVDCGDRVEARLQWCSDVVDEAVVNRIAHRLTRFGTNEKAQSTAMGPV